MLLGANWRDKNLLSLETGTAPMQNRQVSFGAVPPIRAGHECTGIMSPIAGLVHIAEAATAPVLYLVVYMCVRTRTATV